MITATEARKRTDKVLQPVEHSNEFKVIMDHIEADICRAINDGRENILVEANVLQVYNDYKFPVGINSHAIDRTHFWWPFVKAELEKLGYKCRETITCDTYKVCW